MWNRCRDNKIEFLAERIVDFRDILFTNSASNRGPVGYVNCKFDQFFSLRKIRAKHSSFKVVGIIFRKYTTDVLSFAFRMGNSDELSHIFIKEAPPLLCKVGHRSIIPLESKKEVRQAIFSRDTTDNKLVSLFSLLNLRNTPQPFGNTVPFRGRLSCFSKFEVTFPIHLRQPRIRVNIDLSLIPSIVDLLSHLAKNLFLPSNRLIPNFFATFKPFFPIINNGKESRRDTKVTEQSCQRWVVLKVLENKNRIQFLSDLGIFKGVLSQIISEFTNLLHGLTYNEDISNFFIFWLQRDHRLTVEVIAIYQSIQRPLISPDRIGLKARFLGSFLHIPPSLP